DVNNVNETIGSLAGIDGTTVNLGSGTLTVGASSMVLSNFAGTISGTGGLTKVGIGQQNLSGTAANTYTGVTTINTGILLLNKAAGLNAILGNVVVGDGIGGVDADVLRLGSDNQIANTASVTVNSSGLLDLAGLSETIGSLAGPGDVNLGSGTSGVFTVGDS